MDERLLFERFHEALDVDPRPAAYERMRSALIKSTSTPRRRAAFHMRWTKMGLRLAAAIALVAIGVTVGYVILTTHRVAQNNVPAKLDAQAVAYQQMVNADDVALGQSESNHCDTIADTGCPAALLRIKVAAQKWLNDLDSTPPSAFATTDQRIRLHLTALMSDIDYAIAAFNARNQDAMVNAINAGGQEAAWLSSTSVATAHARPSNTSDYVANAKGSRLLLDSCTYCKQLIGQEAAGCSPNPYPSCDLEIVDAKQTVTGLQNGAIVLLAPSSLRDKDGRLEADLAVADDALLALRRALLTGDLKGWDSQRVIFGNALTAVRSDLNSIIGT